MSREEEITKILKQHGERLRHLETLETSAYGDITFLADIDGLLVSNPGAAYVEASTILRRPVSFDTAGETKARIVWSIDVNEAVNYGIRITYWSGAAWVEICKWEGALGVGQISSAGPWSAFTLGSNVYCTVEVKASSATADIRIYYAGMEIG